MPSTVLSTLRNGRSAGFSNVWRSSCSRGLAVVMAVLDVLQEEIDFLDGDDVADVLGAAQAAEGEADHLVAGQRGAAAVAGVDGGVDLDAQAGDGEIIAGEIDAGDDALGDGEVGAAGGKAVDEDGVLDARELGGPGQRGVRREEGLVLQLEHGEVDAGGDELEGGRQLVAGLVGLHLDLAGVEGDVGVGQDAVALDDHAGARDLDWRLLGPGPVGVGVAHGGEHLDDRVLQIGGSSGGGTAVAARAAGEAGASSSAAKEAWPSNRPVQCGKG